jgi:hypothetical protein
MSQSSQGYSEAHRAVIEAMRRVADDSRSLPDQWRGAQLRLLSRLLVRLPTRISAQEFASTSLWLIGKLADMRRENPALAPVCLGLEEELRDAIELGWEALPGLSEVPEKRMVGRRL